MAYNSFGLRLDLAPTKTAASSAARPPQQFVQSASAPGGFSGLFPQNTQQQKASTPQAVQGAQDTRPAPSPAPSNTGGVGTDYGATKDAMLKGLIPWDDNKLAQLNMPDDSQVRNDINSGYNAYFANLDRILNEDLPGQRAAQEGMIANQYNQGVNQLNTQRDLSLQDFQTERQGAEKQQVKTLQDLSNNIRNLFQAGNVYLGSRGAADSSAANQYSYALTKMGSQQRGDVASQFADINNDINTRESKLKQVYDSEIRNLDFEKNSKINEVAQWFGEQQNAIRQARGQGELNRGQDLAQLSQNMLNVALQRLAQVEAEQSNRRQALEQWAINNANSISQVKSNLAQLNQGSYSMPESRPISGMPSYGSGNLNPSLYGYGVDETKKTNIFGQPIA